MSGQDRTAASALFQRLWDDLVTLLGTVATATILGRCLKRAAPDIPELAKLRIERKGLEYTSKLPAAWADLNNQAAVSAVRRLVTEELDPLLRELTGDVVCRRLAAIMELAPEGSASRRRIDDR